MRRVTAAVVAVAVLFAAASPAFAGDRKRLESRAYAPRSGHHRHRHRDHGTDFFVELSGELVFAGISALLDRSHRHRDPEPVLVVVPPPPPPAPPLVMSSAPPPVAPAWASPPPSACGPAAVVAPVAHVVPVAHAASSPCWSERTVVEPAVYEMREVPVLEEVEVAVFEDRTLPVSEEVVEPVVEQVVDPTTGTTSAVVVGEQRRLVTIGSRVQHVQVGIRLERRETGRRVERVLVRPERKRV